MMIKEKKTKLKNHFSFMTGFGNVFAGFNREELSLSLL